MLSRSGNIEKEGPRPSFMTCRLGARQQNADVLLELSLDKHQPADVSAELLQIVAGPASGGVLIMSDIEQIAGDKNSL